MCATVHELYRSSNGDVWFLEKSDEGSLFVIHQGNLPSGGSRTRLSVEEFLKSSRPSPEREALDRALRALENSELDEEALDKGHEATMSQHELVNVIAEGDAAINAENFDAVVTFYAEDATLVIEPGRCVTGRAALRKAFVAIAEHFNHTLHVSQEEVLVLEGAGTALVLAKTRVRATLKSGEPYDVLRHATYVFRREDGGQWRCTVDNSYGTELLSSATG